MAVSREAVEFHIAEQKRLGYPPLPNPELFAEIMESDVWRAEVGGPVSDVWETYRLERKYTREIVTGDDGVTVEQLVERRRS